MKLPPDNARASRAAALPNTLASAARRATILGLIVASSATCAPEAPPPPLPPPTVRVTAVATSQASRELRLSGTLEAERSIALSFSTIGTVEQVFVQEGEAVTAGQPLARISPRSYADAVGVAKAAADRAEDAYRRLEPMHQNQTVADVKMVEVQTGLQQARLSLSMAQRSLDDTILRAPEAAIVARRSVEPGMSATPALPAFILVRTRTMMASAPVPELQIARVHKGDPARVSVAALGKTYDATVHDIAVTADPLTRTYTVRTSIPNLDGAMRIGMVAEVRMTVDSVSRNLVVPPEAVRVDETGSPCVFIVTKTETLERRHVEVAGFAGEGTALTAGVTAGELVVTSGTPMLADGIPVHIQDRVAQDGATP
jgi:RND family efflux transporter MFP subunit